VEQGLRPLLISAMMACLAVLLGDVLEIVAPLPSGAFFPLFVFFACLEGIVSERPLRERRASGWELGLARGAELVVLMLLFKVTLTLLPGPGALREALERWLAHPGEMVGAADLTYGTAMLLLWSAALSVGRLALELDEEVGRGPEPADKTSAAYYLWLTQAPPQRDREGALARLGTLFVWGGTGALILAAAGQGLAGAAVGLPTVLYFMLGLALLTQARFAVVRGVWQFQEVHVEARLGRRWLAWAVLFLVGIGVLALLVPSGFLEVPVQMVRTAILVAAYWVSYLVMLILYLLSIPLGLLIPKMESPERPEVPSQSEPLLPVEPWGGTAAWVRTAGAALFWVALAALMLYAAVRFVRDRWTQGRGGHAARARFVWWGRLVAWLRGLWRRSAGLVQAERLRRMRSGVSEEAGASARVRWPSLRRLAPGERVRFFYLSTVRRAAEAGSPRAPGATPYEYRTSLEEQFPAVESELEGLTEAFVSARYSRHRIEVEQAERVKPLWQRIQAVLRRARNVRV